MSGILAPPRPGISLRDGQAFGKYELVERLAAGGMAEVYLANFTGAAGFSKRVVLKLVLPELAEDAKFIEMFLDEGRLAARLSHPNIAQTFELGETEGRYYLAMEYVAGESLSALRRRRGEKPAWPLVCAVRIAAQLLEALDYAHALKDESGRPLGLIHRDVSPSNVLVTFHGGVKLVDFGIARARHQQHQTQVGVVRGKAGFMAPEQCLDAPIDHRADIFAVGAVLYVLATGREPYPRFDSMEEAIRAMREARFEAPRLVNRGVPPGLERIILRAMARQPADRYPTAGAALGELERFAAEEGLYPSPRELSQEMRRLCPDKADLADETRDSNPELPEAVTQTFNGRQPAGFTRTVSDRGPAAPKRSRRALWALGLLTACAVAAAGAALVRTAIRVAPPPAPVAEPPHSEAVAVAAVPVHPEPPSPASPPAARPASAPHKRPPAVTARPAPANGSLRIDAYPWVHVLLAGRDLGVTPLSTELPAGRHELLLENVPLKVKQTVSVLIKPGEETVFYQKLPVGGSPGM